MPTVVTFWQYPDEEKQFLDFLNKTGRVMAIPSDLVASESELAPQPLSEYIVRHDPDHVLFGLDKFAEKRIIKRIEVEGKPKLCVTSMDSCLIGYVRGKFRDRSSLGQFNLDAYWTRLSDDEKELVDKDPEFCKWGKKVFSWIRKATPEWHMYKGYRVTLRVKEALAQGEVDIVP